MRLVASALLLAATAAAAAQSQTSSSRPLSATVVGSYVVRGGQLTLLVLWRGSPGWFAGNNGSAGGGGGSSSGGRETGSVWFSSGGKSFSIDFDYTAGTAGLLDQVISLSETNVVLVDDVDLPTGARIVNRLWVDPRLPEQPAPDPTLNQADQSLAMMRGDPILATIRRLPALGEYLQCDVPAPVPSGLDAAVPDPAVRARIVEYTQTMISMVCRQATAP